MPTREQIVAAFNNPGAETYLGKVIYLFLKAAEENNPQWRVNRRKNNDDEHNYPLPHVITALDLMLQSLSNPQCIAGTFSITAESIYKAAEQLVASKRK